MEGYNSLTGAFSCCSELVIFRKFALLRYRNLMMLQAELMSKEKQQLELIVDDRESGDPTRESFAVNFDALLNDKSEEGSRQRELLMETRPVLKEYGMSNDLSLNKHTTSIVLIAFDYKEKSLLRAQRMHHDLPPVNKPNLEVLRGVFHNIPIKHHWFKNFEYWTWNKKHEYDLTSLLDRDSGMDMLTRWITWIITKPYHELFGKEKVICTDLPEDWRPLHPIRLSHYKDEHIAGIVTVSATILAPMLPTAGAFCLYFIHDELLRLCMIVLFSFLFSSAVAVVGMRRRIDSFIATASFSAVLIVFVSPNGN
ncbi:hypothetical protein H2204_001887 [Knufia peltigerae]|uniref:DUF6594 domain-containing protein n=1 Tax=Knufia peltigerae TaxID=1002370 RepID=A0AA38YCM2_9EURO|nr:hypothetical protein H2204_001887 [Knufia peltigerae]